MNYLPGYGLALHIVRDDHMRQGPQVTGHISCHQLASYLSGGGGQDDDNVLATWVVVEGRMVAMCWRVLATLNLTLATLSVAMVSTVGRSRRSVMSAPQAWGEEQEHKLDLNIL